MNVKRIQVRAALPGKKFSMPVEIDVTYAERGFEDGSIGFVMQVPHLTEDGEECGLGGSLIMLRLESG